MTAEAIAQRVEAKVERQEDGCWLWRGAITATGYGTLSVKGRTQYAHRVAYTTWRGEIPDGLTIDHLCRNRACVNPDHLEVTTMRDNLLRGESPSAVNAVVTECPEGHPYDEANTYRHRGKRYCRICTLAASNRYKARRRANG